MKIRTGHVTNSSSSSFAILGTSSQKFIDAAKAQGIDLLAKANEGCEKEEWLYLKLPEALEEKGWVQYGQYSPYDGAGEGDGYVGEDLEKMPQDITLQQFAELAVENIEKKTGVKMDPNDFSVISEGWYNG